MLKHASPRAHEEAAQRREPLLICHPRLYLAGCGELLEAMVLAKAGLR